MGNALTEFFGGRTPQKREEVQDAMRRFAKTPVGNGRALLRLTKSGDWVFGTDNEELDVGTELYADPMSLAAGYIAWHKGQIEAEIMQLISEGPVDPNRLHEVQAKKGWENQSSIDLLLPDDDQPVQLTYKTSSVGGKRMLIELAGDFAEAYAADPRRRYAVITIDVDSYTHKEYGEVFTPVFEIKGWLDEEGKPIQSRKKLV